MRLLVFVLSLLCLACNPCGDKDIPLRADISGFRNSDISIVESALEEWNKALDKTVLVSGHSLVESAELDSFDISTRYDSDDTTAGTSHGGNCDIVVNMESVEFVAIRMMSEGHTYEDAMSTRNDALKMVAMHELGHSLGEIGHSSNPDSLMAGERVLFTPMTCIDADSVALICFDNINCPDTAASTCTSDTAP